MSLFRQAKRNKNRQKLLKKNKMSLFRQTKRNKNPNHKLTLILKSTVKQYKTLGKTISHLIFTNLLFRFQNNSQTSYSIKM